MKKTVRINISGYIFNIDEDAYEKLSKYLEEINNHFSNTSEGKEILSDIEARIAELFQSKTNENKQVINISDVESVIETMGHPEDFESYEEEDDQEAEKSTKFAGSRFGRQIYRDPDDRILGGVSSGLAHYFGIDPLIVRIIFGILIAVYGSGTLVYIILWIVVPEAKTTAQKLEMRGEKVTINNIEKSIKDEFYSVKDNFMKWTQSKSYKKTRDSVDNFGNFIISLLKILLRITAVFIGVIFIITGISTVGGLIFGLFTDFSVFTDELNFLSLSNILEIFATPFNSKLFILGLLLTIGIPFIYLTYLGFKIVFNFKTNDKLLGISSIILLIIGVFIMSFATINTTKYYDAEAQQHEEFTLRVNTDTLYIKTEITDSYIKEALNTNHYSILNIDDLRFYKDYDKFDFYIEPKFDIQKSDSKQFELYIEYISRGENKTMARKNCEKIKYEWQQLDSLLYLAPIFSVENSKRWNVQLVKIILFVPEGKTVYIDNYMEQIIYDIDNVQNIWDHNMIKKFWIMTEKGLSLTQKDLNSDTDKETEKINKNSDTTRKNSDLKQMENELDTM